MNCRRSHRADCTSGCSESVAGYPARAARLLCPRQPLTATSVPGSDIGDRVNHALKSCSLQCTVYIPAGNYSFSVPIRLQLNTYGRYKLSGDPGAILTYTGERRCDHHLDRRSTWILSIAYRRISAQGKSACGLRNSHAADQPDQHSQHGHHRIFRRGRHTRRGNQQLQYLRQPDLR